MVSENLHSERVLLVENILLMLATAIVRVLRIILVTVVFRVIAEASPLFVDLLFKQVFASVDHVLIL